MQAFKFVYFGESYHCRKVNRLFNGLKSKYFSFLVSVQFVRQSVPRKEDGKDSYPYIELSLYIFSRDGITREAWNVLHHFF